MTKKLSKHGNSLALVIDRSILDLLDIDEQTPLQISTDGRALVRLCPHMINSVASGLKRRCWIATNSSVPH